MSEPVFRWKGKVIRKSAAQARVIDAWITYGLQQPGEYFATACEQSQDGYIAREVVEGNCEGLTIRHANEEQH